jgi:hypothetical protein
MTTEKKEQAVTLLRQGLETIQHRAYTEIAEIPTENSGEFQVKYSFVHDDIEGIFTVIGQLASLEQGEMGKGVGLSATFGEDAKHDGSAEAKAQVEKDLESAEGYINAHIDQERG